MQGGRGALQRVIERLLDGLAEREIGLVVLRDRRAFEVACERFRAVPVFPPACSPMRGGASRFWLRMENARGQGVATISVTAIESDDLFVDIRSGALWLEGGFADYCGLMAIEATPPSRLVGGRLSLVGIHFAQGTGMDEDVVWNISRLSQALAFRQQDSDFAVMLPDATIDAANLAVLQATFERSDPCIDGWMPLADRTVTAPLLHTRQDEFMAWAQEMLASEAEDEAIAGPADVVEMA